MSEAEDLARKANGKKSETIEIRLSFEEKQAFADMCRAEGKTVSNALRSAITYFLEKRRTDLPDLTAESGHNRKGFMMLFTGFVAGALASVGVSQMMTEDSNREVIRFAEAYMERLDADEDGRISLTEYVTYTNSDGWPLPKASIGSYYIHEAYVRLERLVEPLDDGGLIYSELDENCRVAMLALAGLQHGREFDLLDDDRSGFLSTAEISQSKLLPDVRKLKIEFDGFDSDGDGYWARDEFSGGFNHETNVEQAVSVDTYQTVRLPDICNGTYGSGALMSLQPKGSGLLYGARYQEEILAQLFVERDRNSDGRVSFNEFVDAVKTSIR